MDENRLSLSPQIAASLGFSQIQQPLNFHHPIQFLGFFRQQSHGLSLAIKSSNRARASSLGRNSINDAGVTPPARKSMASSYAFFMSNASPPERPVNCGCHGPLHKTMTF
ncbi:hypothetical protein [Prosthecobacter algae]|uniref:hypothetical protein n=1 Tax=Prosthecobacter algae TaxID=1144682 RepID=UPI0031EB5AC0